MTTAGPLKGPPYWYWGQEIFLPSRAIGDVVPEFVNPKEEVNTTAPPDDAYTLAFGSSEGLAGKARRGAEAAASSGK